MNHYRFTQQVLAGMRLTTQIEICRKLASLFINECSRAISAFIDI